MTGGHEAKILASGLGRGEGRGSLCPTDDPRLILQRTNFYFIGSHQLVRRGLILTFQEVENEAIDNLRTFELRRVPATGNHDKAKIGKPLDGVPDNVRIHNAVFT